MACYDFHWPSRGAARDSDFSDDQADCLMGTAHSTYSYVIHARSLVRPYYTGESMSLAMARPPSSINVI